MEKSKYKWLNEDSRKFLERGYLVKGETPEQRIRDISDTAERLLNKEGFSDKFEDYMSRGFYSLSSPIWSNFGRERGLPIACFGGVIPDTMEGIMEKVSETAIMTKCGGGTSAYFGNVRGRGSEISSGGFSTGSVHFMELFDKLMNVVSQGNVRRGSFAAYLPIDHPDIEEFLKIKSEGNEIQDTSIGVSVSDEWMRKMISGDKECRKIWGLVIKKRFESGYPYIFFSDNANNAAPQVYKDKGLKIHNSNLCVTGDQRVPSNFGLLTAKELYDIGSELTLFDNNKTVKSSPMQLIEKDADVYKITLENGMTHTVTAYHKVLVLDGSSKLKDVACSDLKKGDFVAIQSSKGIFSDTLNDLTQYDLVDEVPKTVWISGESTQSSYVDGLFKNSNRIISTNRSFLSDVQLILANLGVISVIGTENGIDFELLKESVSGSGKHFSAVVSVEHVGKEDVYCVKVDSDEHHWVCNGIVTHNCSEIMLSNSEDESFVCDLSSLNLEKWDEIVETDAIETLIYFLDAVMTEFINKTEGMRFMEAPRKFAINQRALGLGVLGWHSLLQSKMIGFESFDAKMLNASIWKVIRERSDSASEQLAKEYGEAPILKGYGRRNTTTLAVAPTTSSSFILGQVSPSIEPLNSNYFVKDLAKGKFTYKNPYLIELLESKGKNDIDTWKSILLHGGSVQHLDFLTDGEKDVFKTFGEISQKEIVIQAAQRQKWIDQGQSLNLMIPPNTKPKEVNELLIFAWEQGIKSLYYQRSSNPSQQLARSILTCKSCEG